MDYLISSCGMTGYLAIDDEVSGLARHFFSVPSIELTKNGIPPGVWCYIRPI